MNKTDELIEKAKNYLNKNKKLRKYLKSIIKSYDESDWSYIGRDFTELDDSIENARLGLVKRRNFNE